jgi:hypothetical protein
MLDLFTSQVCRASCDRLTADVKLVRRHKMDLGDGWVLWTEDEKPPSCWIHVRLVRSDHSLCPSMTRPQVEYASAVQVFMLTWGLERSQVIGRARGYRHDYPDFEGFAYKVPT